MRYRVPGRCASSCRSRRTGNPRLSYSKLGQALQRTTPRTGHGAWSDASFICVHVIAALAGPAARRRDQPNRSRRRIPEPAPMPNLTMIDEDGRCGSTGPPSTRNTLAASKAD